MKCIYCTTDLPVDGETKQVTCPKCGTELVVNKLIRAWGEDAIMWLTPYEQTNNNRHEESTVGNLPLD